MAERTSLGPCYHKVFAASVASNLGDGVSQIGYPWLASAVTRNPILVAVVAVAQRLPWLVFTLPAGVITDRVDRRRAMVLMDSCRAVLTTLVAIAVLGLGSDLPDPAHIEDVVGTRAGLYVILLVASLLLGFAEVLRDNSAQTIIPSIVEPEQLERANGRMWSAEQVANTFVGPPLGSLLIAGAFFLPFALDAVSFVVAAALVFLVSGSFKAQHVVADDRPRGAWKADLREGFSWLWHHSLLRPMAIILGIMNALGALQIATLVLFSQEVLHTSALEFAVLTMGGAIGSVIGGTTAPWVRRRLGSGPSLYLTLAAGGIIPLATGLTSSWPIVLVLFGVTALVGVLWNVITVSLRQAIIPDHLLGRVNSVYRFFAWGMMPIGTALGGLLVTVVEPRWGRGAALRVPWFVAGGVGLALLVYAVPRLTSAKLDAARDAAVSSSGSRP
ncbi:MAG: MFS transporter [Ilumatobacteraceae bacterium]